jgi:hypothetical protein
MAFERILSILFRAAELAFGVIVLGLSAWWIHHSQASSWGNGRMIYTLVVACLAVLAALIWFIPTAHSFTHYGLDFLFFALFMVSFGLLVDWLNSGCGHVFNWSNVSPFGNLCGRVKALEAFTFLSSIVWLASALLGIYFVHKRRAVVDGNRRGAYSNRV